MYSWGRVQSSVFSDGSELSVSMSAAFRFLKKFEESEHEQGGDDNDHAQSRQVALMQTERAVAEDQVVLCSDVVLPAGQDRR